MLFLCFLFRFVLIFFLHMQRTGVYFWAASLIISKFFNTSGMDKWFTGHDDKWFTKHNNPQSHKTPTLDEEIHSIWIHGSILLDPFIAHDRKKPFRCECFHNSLTLWPMHMPPNATSCFAFESGIKWNMHMIFDKIEVIIPLCRWCLVNFVISLMVPRCSRKCVIKFLVKRPFSDFSDVNESLESWQNKRWRK